MDIVTFPAKMVGFRIDTQEGRIYLHEDPPIMCSEQDVERRSNLFRSLESASRVHYTWVPVPLKDLAPRMQAIRADLERQLAEIQAWQRAQARITPEPDAWDLAVEAAVVVAKERLKDNPLALKRLPKAATIAKSYGWHRMGDKQDTWLIPGTEPGAVYSVNGRCTCPDYQHGGVPQGFCKHRLARALAKKAAAIIQEARVAPVSQGIPCATHIELIVGYQASEDRVLPHTNGNGKLLRFLADGQEAKPPVGSMTDMYRWLEGQGYVPEGFKWLEWEHGVRQRRESYVKPAA
jgi:hypothetical protein